MKMFGNLKRDIRYYLRLPFERYHNRLVVRYIEKHLNPHSGSIIKYDTISEKEKRSFAYEVLNHKEFIIRAATVLIDETDNTIINTFSVASPGHHAECIFFANKYYGRPISTIPNTKQSQGFITNLGRYIDRKEGFKIATAANQINKKHGNPTKLFSEDMWCLTDEREEFKELYLNHWTVKCSTFIRGF